MYYCRVVRPMTLFPKEMESARLRYERLHPEEFDPFELYEIVRLGAPDVEEITKYVRWKPYPHPKQAFDWVEHCGAEFDDGASVTYVMRQTEDDVEELAGLAGLAPDWDRRLATIGAFFRKPLWGRGYFGEQGTQLLELAFDRLDLEVVAVTHDPANEQSQRAIEKLVARFGGCKEGVIRNDLVMNDEPRDSVRYSITRDEWNDTRA
jgi:RimJ/RimL family protein N-acetyltransferase